MQFLPTSIHVCSQAQKAQLGERGFHSEIARYDKQDDRWLGDQSWTHDTVDLRIWVGFIFSS